MYKFFACWGGVSKNAYSADLSSCQAPATQGSIALRCFCDRIIEARMEKSTPAGPWWKRFAPRMVRGSAPLLFGGVERCRPNALVQNFEVFNEQGESRQLKLFPYRNKAAVLQAVVI